MIKRVQALCLSTILFFTSLEYFHFMLLQYNSEGSNPLEL